MSRKINNVISVQKTNGLTFIQTERFELYTFYHNNLERYQNCVPNSRIKNAVLINNKLYYLCYSGKIYSFEEKDKQITDKSIYEIIDFNSNILCGIESVLDIENFYFKYSVFEIETNKIVFEIDKMKMVTVVNNVVVCNDDNTIYIFKLSLLSNALSYHKSSCKYSFESLSPITTYHNQLICTINQNRILGVNMDNGIVEWEVNTLFDVDGKERVISELPRFKAVEKNKIIFCSGILYEEFDLEAKKLIIRKYFGPLNNILSTEIFVQQITLENDLLFFVSENMKTKRWHTVGVFDTNTLEVIWTFDLDLPKTVILNNAPIVDEEYLYITDSASTLHIFEKGKCLN